jgi:hypothetical protein
VQAVKISELLLEMGFAVTARLDQTVGLVSGFVSSARAFGSLFFFRPRFRTNARALFSLTSPFEQGVVPESRRTCCSHGKKGSLVDFPGLAASSHFSRGQTDYW